MHLEQAIDDILSLKERAGKQVLSFADQDHFSFLGRFKGYGLNLQLHPEFTLIKCNRYEFFGPVATTTFTHVNPAKDTSPLIVTLDYREEGLGRRCYGQDVPSLLISIQRSLYFERNGGLYAIESQEALLRNLRSSRKLFREKLGI